MCARVLEQASHQSSGGQKPKMELKFIKVILRCGASCGTELIDPEDPLPSYVPVKSCHKNYLQLCDEPKSQGKRVCYRE